MNINDVISLEIKMIYYSYINVFQEMFKEVYPLKKIMREYNKT